MIVTFYQALKNVLSTNNPYSQTGIKSWQYDYGQYDAEKVEVYAAKAVYISVGAFQPMPTTQTNSVMRVENFLFQLALVQHTKFSDDKRITDAGLDHWGTVSKIVQSLQGSSLRLSDVPGSTITPGSAEDGNITNFIYLEGVTPESDNGSVIVTKISFRCVLHIWDFTPNFVIVSPDIQPSAEIVDSIPPTTTLQPLFTQ